MKKETTVQVRISKALRDELKIAVAEDKRNMTEVVNEIVKIWLDERKANK